MNDTITLLLAIEARDRATQILESIAGKVHGWEQSMKTAAAQATRTSEQVELANTRAAASTASYDRAVAAQVDAQHALAAAMGRSQAAMEAQELAEERDAAAVERAAAVVREAAAAEEAALVKLQEAEKLVATRSAEMSAAQETAAGKTGVGAAAIKGLTVAAAASVLAVGAIGVESVKAAGDYEASTNRLVTSAGETHDNLEKVRKGMLDMAGQVGYSSDQLSQAMYKIESGGQHGADGLTVLRAAAEGAKTENASLETVADAVTSILVDYHLKADDAATVTSKMVAATSAGKMTFEQLAGSMSAIMPIASAAGVSLNDILGDLASMTVHGMSAQQAAQNLADTIRHMQNPTAVQAKELALLGMTTTQLADDLKSKGLSGALNDISEHVLKMIPPGSDKVIGDLRNALNGLDPKVRELAMHLFDGSMSNKDYAKAAGELPPILAKQAQSFGTLAGSMHRIGDQQMSGSDVMQTYGQALAKVTGDATGLNTILMISGENTGVTADAIKTVTDATTEAGNHVKGWGDIQQTFNYKLDALKGKLEAAKIEIGQGLLPTVSDLTTHVIGVVTPITHWISTHEQLTAKILTTVAAVGTLTLAIIGVSKAFGAVKTAYDIVMGSTGLLAKTTGTLNGILAFTKTALTDAGGEAGRFRNALDAAKTAASDTRGGLGGLKDFIANPLTLALGAGVLLIGAFANAHARAQQIEKTHTEGVRALTDAIKANNGAITDNVRQVAAKQASDQGALELGKKTGVNLGELTDAYIHGGQAIESIKKQLDAYIIAQKEAMAHDEQHSTVYTKNIKNAEDLDAILDAQKKAIDSNASSGDLQAEALNRMDQSGKKLTNTDADLVGKLEDVRKGNLDAASSSDILKQAQDRLYGTAQNADQANEALAAAIDASTQAMQSNDNAIDMTTAAHRQNRDTLISRLKATNDVYFADMASAKQSGDVAKATAEATQKHDDAVQALLNEATKNHLNRDQVQALIDTYGKVPDAVTTELQVLGYADATGKLSGLGQAIADIMNKWGIDASIAANLVKSGLSQNVGRRHATGGPVFGDGTETSDSIPAWLSDNEHVWTAAEVRAAGGHGAVQALRQMALAGRIGGDGAALMGFAQGGPVVDMTWSSNITRWPAYQAFVSGLSSTVDNLRSTLNAGDGGGASQWSGVALSVLSQLGQPSSLLGAVLRRIDLESGGNPAIVNTTDSNWFAGTPSVGLAQVIGPTFAAYAGPYRNVGPFLYGVSTNPMANLYAGMNYALSRYGSIAAIDPLVHPGGYAAGGPVHVGVRDRGGPVYPGANLIYNGTGKTEWVNDPQAPSGGGNTVIIDLRESKVMSDRDIDVLLDRINRRLVQELLPAAGVQIRR